MFGTHLTRIAELSRPGYARELEEYARLEFPTEDPRTVRLLVEAAAKRPSAFARSRSWLLRWFAGTPRLPAGNV